MAGVIVETHFPGIPGRRAQPEAQVSQYLKHKKNGSVYPWTSGLAKNRNMVPCDKDGNELHEGSGRMDPYPQQSAQTAEVARAELEAQASEIRQTHREASVVGDSLDGLDMGALRAFAESQRIELDNRWREDRVRKHIRDVLAQRPQTQAA